jgi:hypothetical protein
MPDPQLTIQLVANDEGLRAKLREVNDSIRAQQKQYSRAFASMDSVFGGFIRNLTSGTKTFGQAWAAMVDSMAAKFLQGLERQLAGFLAHKLSELTIHTTTEAAKDTISAAGHARESVRTAYSAAKHAFDATADIPIVGPVLAPIAAAGAFAAVTALGSAEGGQYLVPAPQLTMLHPQEMVLPAAIASRMRDVVEGRASSSAQPVTVIVQHSVSAVDAESFQQHLRRHGNLIGNEVARALRRKGLTAK